MAAGYPSVRGLEIVTSMRGSLAKALDGCHAATQPKSLQRVAPASAADPSGIPHNLGDGGAESRRRPEDYVVVLEHDPGDESRPGLVTHVPSLEKRLLDRVGRPHQHDVAMLSDESRHVPDR